MKELNDYTGNGTWNYNHNLNFINMKKLKAIAIKVSGWVLAVVLTTAAVFLFIKFIKLVWIIVKFIWNV